MRPWPRDIEAALLYPTAPPVLLADILDPLNHRLENFGMQFRVTSNPGRNYIVLSNGPLRIVISLNAAPLAPSVLATALASAYTHVRAHDYSGATDRHRHTACITVSDTNTGASAQAPVPVETKIVICHVAVRVLMSFGRPEAVHWVQSDNLFAPEEIAAAEGFGFPVTLVTHPALFSEPGEEGGGKKTGFVSNNSEHFFGKPVVVEPTTVPLDEALTFVDLCIMRKLHGVDMLRDGARLPFSASVEIRVAHRPADAAFPQGAIDLSFRRPDPCAQRHRPPFAAPETGLGPLSTPAIHGGASFGGLR
jgi:hypothetical protein